MKTFIILAIIAVAFSIQLSRTETEKKKKTKKSKSSTETATKGSWSINNNNDYKIQIQVNYSSQRSTGKFNTEGVYPANKVAANRLSGWFFNSVSAKSDLSTVATQEGTSSTWYIDYKDCEKWHALPESTGDSNPRKIGCNITTKTGGHVWVYIWFEYSSWGNFITKEDLKTMTSTLNTLTSNRKNAITTQTTIANNAAVAASAKYADAATLKKPVSSYDESINKAKADKAVYEAEITGYNSDIESNNAAIKDLQAKIDLKTQANTATGAKRDIANQNLNAAQKSITELTASKSNSQSQNQAAATLKETEAATEITKITTAMGQVATICANCAANANAAKTEAKVSPFNKSNTIAKIAKIEVAN